MWNPIDHNIFIDQKPIGSYTSHKFCTSCWHVYLNCPMSLHTQKPCKLQNDQAWLCSLHWPSENTSWFLFPKLFEQLGGDPPPKQCTVGWSIKIPSLPSQHPGTTPPQSSTNGSWKRSENLAESKGISEYPGGLIFRWSMLNFTWYPIHIHELKCLFQLDDEPNFYLGNGWKSPFPSINGCLLGGSSHLGSGW